MSARMGVCASPNLALPPVTRRQTLTGIKTSAVGARTSAHYTKQTISAVNKKREKSPAAAIHKKKSPRHQDIVEKHREIMNMRKAAQGKPVTNAEKRQATLERRRSTAAERKNSTLERKPSTNLKEPTVERRPSSSKDRPKNNVRRTASSNVRRRGEGSKPKARKRDDRRFLTIGYTEEVRSPLRECQNIHANVKRYIKHF